jgi:4-hydroxy-2-oxoheptanedioate aldolase
MQHGLIGYDAAQPILTALRTRDVVPMVRTPPLYPALIMKLLDAGILGITCASVETAEQAAGLVRACRYPPAGERSMGPVRASLIYDDYEARAASLVTAFAMIETSAGVRNLDEILDTPGLDGLYIGPYDLAMSLGFPPGPNGAFAPEVDRAIDHILKRCRSANLICGMLAPHGAAAFGLVQRGFQFVTVSNDVRALRGMLGQWMTEFRAAGEPGKGS